MRHDAIIIGGSFAGLSAATYIARGRRSVCIIDTGAPRNRFAAHSHGFLTRDGSEPGALIAAARSQVAAYPTATFIEGKAIGAAREPDGFSVKLATGEVLASARLVLAFGIADELPAIPGLPERWGKSVLHCPYCHGFEFSGRRLGVLNVSPMSAHQAMLIAEWGPTTFYLNGASGPEDALLAQLQKRGVAIEPAPVRALHGDGAQLSAVELIDGRTSDVEALYLGPRNRLNSDIAQQLGCELEEMPLGSIIRTDGDKMTTVPGVYAAGDITRSAHNATWASADGVTAGVAVHRSLVFP
ncbi:MAG TPA: NAD(P)/FAD-dependent oxidoreductase [Thermoanaerobaculia bacterium]|jgi:thioredoxin reductase|nr:NAD(P)/FAD-dependent oxidoreductase [Thermoanaerobaculia bacterium]